MTIIFWSRGKAYKLNPILNADKSEIIRCEIDKDFGEGEDDYIHSNAANLPYD